MRISTTPRDLPRAAPDTESPIHEQAGAGTDFRALFLENPQPMWVYALGTLQFLEVNDAAVQHYGYSRDEFLEMTIAGVRQQGGGPKDVDEVASPRADSQAGSERRHRRKNGQIIDVEVTFHTLTFRGLEAQLEVVRDVTRWKREELELKQSEREYRHIFEDAIVGIYQSTPDGRLLSVNPSMAQMFGFDSPGEMIASITDIQTQLYVDPDQREEFKRRMLEH
jgi:PAS domain S-box-containing protein